MDLAAPGPPPSSPPGCIEISRESASRIVAAMGIEGDRVEPRFARGCRCFAIAEAGNVIAYGWVSPAPEWVGELSLEMTPGPGEAYVWNCFTLPQHRRRGHYRALLRGIVTRFREEGLGRLWIGSLEIPAEKADADAGFVPVLLVECATFGPVRRLRVAGAPGAGTAVVSEAMSRLGLRGPSHFGRRRSRVH